MTALFIYLLASSAPRRILQGSRGGYPLAALGSEDWCDAFYNETPSHNTGHGTGATKELSRERILQQSCLARHRVRERILRQNAVARHRVRDSGTTKDTADGPLRGRRHRTSRSLHDLALPSRNPPQREPAPRAPRAPPWRAPSPPAGGGCSRSPLPGKEELLGGPGCDRNSLPHLPSQSVSLTHLQAWRTGPHAHTRCTRLAREPTPAVAPGPDCWTHSTQLTEQLTRCWRCIVGFSGTDTGEEGGAQGRGHRTHELISHPAPGAVARASAGVFGPAVWQAPGHRSAGGALSRIRDPRRLSEEIRRGAGRVLLAHTITEFTMKGGRSQRREKQLSHCGMRYSCCSARAVVKRVRALEPVALSIAGACAPALRWVYASS